MKRGGTLLDAGCGSGIVSVLATEGRVDPTGLDASPAFIDVAREKCPSGQFLVGDLGHDLPFDSEAFDGVVFCNSLQFVANPAAAVRETARVLRPGGRVAIAVFDIEARCQGSTPISAILSLLPKPDPGAPGPFSLSNAETLEALVDDAGLRSEGIHTVESPWRYPDLETARRAFMSAGPSHQARELVGEEKLREALDAATAPFRQPDGTYLLQNSFIFVVARKSERAET